MCLFNSKIEFIGSGKIKANVDTILFEDTYLTGTLALAEAGQADLDSRFVSNSILGAINELMQGLTDTSGLNRVICYAESVDSAAYVHTLTHSLNTFDLTLQMYDADPESGPGARPVIVCWTPTDADTVRVELDAPASGHFVIFGCPGGS
jgi:hypothetical protein